MPDNTKASGYEEALWNYIATLESVNQVLLDTVKQCVKILTPLK